MTEHHDIATDEALQRRLRAALADLPEPTPAGDLFLRVQATRRRRRWQRRLLQGGGCAAALGLIALLPFGGEPPSVVPVIEVVDVAERNHQQALRRADRRLQAAYDRGADAEQLHALWQAREQAASRTVPSEDRHETLIRL